jgi:hypothetical protein
MKVNIVFRDNIMPINTKIHDNTVDALSYEALSYGNLLVMESVSGPEKNTFKLKEIDSLCYGSS